MNITQKVSGKKITLTFTGDFIKERIPPKTTITQLMLSSTPTKEIHIDGKNIKDWDSNLLVALYNIYLLAKKNDIKMSAELPQGIERMIQLAFSSPERPQTQRNRRRPFVEKIGNWGWQIYSSTKQGFHFIGNTLQSIGRFFTGRATMRRIDFLFALEDCGPSAIGIVGLISLMVGLILAFVGAAQLKLFGAQIYVSSLVAIGMTRIMGAMMVGIIIAGRTGSSYAATIGTMPVNEELDALKTMGISRMDFLVLPRILALTLIMPFLTLLADGMGIIGGGIVGVFMLDISIPEYWKYTLDALQLNHFFVGIFHGFVFGIIISLCGCYYGIHCGRDADSVGAATTKAVVSAIVWMVVLTGMITYLFEVLGI